MTFQRIDPVWQAYISVMTAATSRKTRPCTQSWSAVAIGDDIFIAFQPMRIFYFWRNEEFTFF